MITEAFLRQRAERAIRQGYPKQKWVLFCEEMLERGYTLNMYEARRTVSKYITVCKGQHRFKVRFSNHAPIREREKNGDCDFFVGRTNLKVTTTRMAIDAVEQFFASKEQGKRA